MIVNKQGVIFRTRCGCHRYALLDADPPETVERPLIPYKKNLTEEEIQKALAKPETPRRVFKYNGAMEYGAYSEKCRVYEETTEAEV